MKTNFTKRFLNWLKRALLWTSVIIFMLAIIGTVYQTVATETNQKKFPPSGNLINVGGFKMHIYCMGEGSPTVILESMSGGGSPYWGWVQPELAKETRVCVYDRAGFYWSESDPEPQTLARTVRNLHTLLTNANIAGPYVLVGHSIGGLYVRQFAEDYPKQVAGLVLLDSGDPQQFNQNPDLFAESDSFLRLIPLLQTLNNVGVSHLFFALGGEMDFSDLLEPQKSQVKAFWASSRYFDVLEMELRASHGIWSDALKLGGLGDLPLTVISRSIDLDHDWKKYQDNLAALSTNSQHITVDGSTHGSLVFNPAHAHIVSEAILQIVDAVRSGNR